MVLLESVKNVGAVAASFSLEDGAGVRYNLEDFADKKVLVVVFMCNHCPYVIAVKDRLNALAENMKEKGVQFVGINANDAISYPDDAPEHMPKMGMAFPYLFDETQEVAKAYGAVCTPDIFVYNQERKLSYHGRIDDSWKEPEKVTQQELKEAIEKTLAGEAVAEDAQKPSMGCSIKWKK